MSSISSNFIVALRHYFTRNRGPFCRKKSVLLYLCSLLFAQSYAPEPNPGPRPCKFPCAICTKAVKWTTPGICCDTCDVWYHCDSIGMNEEVYQGFANISWECIQCGLPNFSTGIFDSTIYESSNTFSYLQNVTASSVNDISFGQPTATSSPTKLPEEPVRRKDIPLRVLVLNCQSAKADGKPAQLQNLISSLQADIVIGCKPWLSPDIRSAEVFPADFKCYRRDRPHGKGEGVFLLISQKYESDEPEELKVGDEDDCELVWAKVQIKGASDLYIGSFYRPPNKRDTNYLQTLERYAARVPTKNGAQLWIGGDFNLPDINWEDECPKQYPIHGTLNQQLLSLAKDNFLEQVVTEPTRITETSATTLELFFTNNRSVINKTEVIPGISDHQAVFVESSLRPIQTHTPPRKVFIYKKGDFDSMKVELKE